MNGLASLSQRLRTPHELVAVFPDAARAEDARAGLTVFFQWCFAADRARPPSPPVTVLLRNLELDDEEDRLRVADWRKPPALSLAGFALTVDAPSSKHASEIVLRLLRHFQASEVLERRKAGAGRGPIPAFVAVALAALAAAAVAYFFLVRRHA